MRIGSPLRAIQHVLAAVVIGAMAVALNVSSAAIIYQGPLTTFLDRAIAQTLIGGFVMGIASAVFFSYRGTICQPQTALASILSFPAASIAVGMADPVSESSFSTIAALVVTTTTLIGAATLLLGSLRLGTVARFIPFPVVTGFMAATGYLITMGAFGMALGRRVTLGDVTVLFGPGNPIRWVPWLVAALAIIALTRRLRQPIVFPLGLLVAGTMFYIVVALSGIGVAGARQAGMLLGPFGGDGLLPALLGWQPLAFDGRALLAQAPSIAAAVGFAVVGTVMGTSSLEVAFGHRLDPDRDLRCVGVANLTGAATGSLGGFPALAQTLLAHGMGISGAATGGIVALACALAVSVGAAVLSVLPIGIFVTGVLVVGLNLLIGPLIDRRQGMPAADYLVVLCIPAVTAVFGFLWGVATGLVAAALFFILAFARIEVVRLATTGARLRSRVERSDADQARLAVLGREASIYSLEGYIFFGTADRLAQRVEAALVGRSRSRYVLIDFRRVGGLDSSAARALVQLSGRCQARGVSLCFAGLNEPGATAVRGQLPPIQGDHPWFANSLEKALKQVEEALLATDDPAAASCGGGFLDQFQRRHPSSDLARYGESTTVPAGTEVLAQGAASDCLLVIRSGTLRIEVLVEGGPPITIAHCLPGSLVGEIGFYTGTPRTARVVAEKTSDLLRIDADALERMAADDPVVLADFHRMVAAILARRLGRTTSLLADAEVLAR